jgi:hypothetical protein
VVRPGAAVGDQLIAHAAGERQVGDTVAVEMAELAPSDPELDAAKSVRRCLDPGP